jgi:hypothetical protein
MAKSEETSYFAQGPTNVGFECHGNIPIGVGVIGKECGVLGQSHEYADTFSKDTRNGSGGTGVFGRGISSGVEGEGVFRGVYGKGAPEGYGQGALQDTGNKELTTGVLGEGYNRCPGIVGLCFSTIDRSNLGDRSGVIGASNANSIVDSKNKRNAGAG